MSEQTQIKISARFYRLNNELHRKILDLKKEEASDIDLIIVMLNPGSCGRGVDLLIDKDVPVKADPTLHRIRRFMAEQSLNWVRVLNLYDLCEPDGAKILRTLKNAEAFPAGSMFADDVESTFPPDVPVLLAWGASANGLKLAQAARNLIRRSGRKILNDSDSAVPWHPLMRPVNGRKWWSEYASVAWNNRDN